MHRFAVKRLLGSLLLSLALAGCGGGGHSSTGGVLPMSANLRALDVIQEPVVPPGTWPMGQLPHFANSVFAQTLPANPKIAATSDQMLAPYGSIQLQFGGLDKRPLRYNSAPPMYYAKTSDPVYTIHCDAWTGNSCPSLEGKSINIPSYAKWGSYPSPNCSGCAAHGNFDGQMVIISPDGQYEYDLFQADRFSGNPAGGPFTIASGEAFPIAQYNEFGPSSWQGSATASRRALSAGVIWPQELLAGIIPHALIVSAPCVNGNNVYPAKAGSGLVCPGGGGLPEGARLWLDATDAQIAAAPVSQVTKMYYTAAKNYGIYVTDTAGGNNWYVGGGPSIITFLDAQQPEPWPYVAQKYGMPWVQMDLFAEFLSPLDGQQPALAFKVVDPCVTQKTC